MQTFRPLTKLLVIPAFRPSFAAAEGLWNGLKAGAGNAYERSRSLFDRSFCRTDEALDAPAPLRNN